MCNVPVLYATSEGQTRRISERLAQILREQGLSSAAIDVSSAEARAVDWPHVRGAVVAASLHAGRHQRPASEFARAHAAELSAIPSLFVSVSLSAASKYESERDAAPKTGRRLRHGRGVEALAGRVRCREACLHPVRVSHSLVHEAHREERRRPDRHVPRSRADRLVLRSSGWPGIWLIGLASRRRVPLRSPMG